MCAVRDAISLRIGRADPHVIEVRRKDDGLVAACWIGPAHDAHDVPALNRLDGVLADDA